MLSQTSSVKCRRFINGEDDIRMEKGSNGIEMYVFNPYNPLNKQITPEDVKHLLSKYGIDAPINNFNLYRRAFVHQSYVKHRKNENIRNNVVIVDAPPNCVQLSSKSNERLEFIGDGVLECMSKYYLYSRFPKENEGFMTEKKISLVKNESIGRMAYEMGLHNWYILSKQTEEKQTRSNMKKLGCLFESFLGALFLDFNKVNEDGNLKDAFQSGGGFQVAQKFIETVFERHVDWIELIRNDDNYKNILQVKIQREFKVTPDYMEINSYSPVTGYHMGVYLCLGQSIHNLNHSNSIALTQFTSYEEIHEYMSVAGKVLVFLGEGHHKIKKKGEQLASMVNLLE